MRLLLLVAIVVALLVFLLMDLGERAVEPTSEVHAAQQWPGRWQLEPSPVVSAPVASAPVMPRARTAPMHATSAGRAIVVGHTDIVVLIHRVFDRFGVTVGDQAVRVFGCETGGTYNPQATNGAHAGLAQLARRWQEARARRLGFTWDQMFQAEPNLIVAADLFGEQGWRPWTCRTAA